MSNDPKTDDHPLASPTELAGSTEGAIAAEFAARDAEQALEDEAAGASIDDDNVPVDERSA